MKVTGRPRVEDINQMIEWLTNRDISTCIKLINEMMVKNGIALNDVITDIHDQVSEIEFPNKIKARILMVSSLKVFFSNHCCLTLQKLF